MPRKLRIGHARAVRVSGDTGTYAQTGRVAQLLRALKATAAQGAYSITGQSATLTEQNNGGPVVSTRALDVARTIVPRLHKWDSPTYERSQIFAPITTDTYFYQFRVFNGIIALSLNGTGTYTLMVDGVAHATVTPSVAGTTAGFTFRAAEAGHGWHFMDIVGPQAETCMPHWVYVDRPGGAAQTVTYAQSGSHDCQHLFELLKVQWVQVPAQYNPTPRPLTPRASYPDVVTADRRPQLYMQHLVPKQGGDIYRSRMTNGVINTANQQNYTINPVLLRYAQYAMLDGPRGVGCINGATHIALGTNSDAIYAAQGQRVVRIEPNGNITTLVGHKHVAPANRPAGYQAGSNDPETIDDFELVGDWSAIEAAGQPIGIFETWGFAWDEWSVRRDTSQTIPNDLKDNALENPHFSPGPKLLIADTQNNRILSAVFSPTQHNLPPTVTIHVGGLSDPWDCVAPHDGSDTLYVAERMANKISMWNSRTGAFIDNLIVGPTYGSLAVVGGGTGRKAVRLASLASIQAGLCVLPEGLYEQDGWIYFGSLAMQQVCRVNIATREHQVYINVQEVDMNFANAGGQYCKIALSDGTFYPRGTLFMQFWTPNLQNGFPSIYLPENLPTGTRWNVTGNNGVGPGMRWEGMEYGAAVAVGRGRMIFSSSIEGLWVCSKAAGEATVSDASYLAARDAWKLAGHHLAHGEMGFGPYGLPLPWGASTATDDWLTMCGHTPP
jgi:hypothetical protein